MSAKNKIRIKTKENPTPSINLKKENLTPYPVFCFKYLENTSIKKCKNYKFFIDFIFRLQKLGELGWTIIDKSDKHGFGYEKVPISKLKPKKFPKIVTDDVKELTVFRANGNNLPFLGIRMPSSDVFQVIFIETNFGDVYDHQ